MSGEVDPLQDWLGRREVREEVLDPTALRRFAAAVGADLDVEADAPPLAHWAFFQPLAATADLGPDGHPRGGLLPPMPLPRRMFAAADIHFQSPLRLGRPAQLTSTIVGVKRRVGRTGELLFVEVERVLSQGGETPVRERQTLVYREASGATPPAGAAVPLPPSVEIWTPGPVDLFRFSAVTFNSHRIHYDARYATGEEGYPGLVVHGPFTAVRLCDLARRRSGAALRRFSFRAMAPLFVGDPVALARGDGDLQVRAVRTDGEVAMQADFEV